MLIKYKGKKSNNIGKILHNQVFKINVNTNETNKNLVSSDRVQWKQRPFYGIPTKNA